MKADHHPTDYLPETGVHALLRLYDPFTRVTSVGKGHAAPARLRRPARRCPGPRGWLRHRQPDPARCPDPPVRHRDRTRPRPPGTRPDLKARRRRVPITWDHGYAQKLPYPDAAFDLVLSSLMYHHLNQEAQAAMLRERHGARPVLSIPAVVRRGLSKQVFYQDWGVPTTLASDSVRWCWRAVRPACREGGDPLARADRRSVWDGTVRQPAASLGRPSRARVAGCLSETGEAGASGEARTRGCSYRPSARSDDHVLHPGGRSGLRRRRSRLWDESSAETGPDEGDELVKSSV